MVDASHVPKPPLGTMKCTTCEQRGYHLTDFGAVMCPECEGWGVLAPALRGAKSWRRDG